MHPAISRRRRSISMKGKRVSALRKIQSATISPAHFSGNKNAFDDRRADDECHRAGREYPRVVRPGHACQARGSAEAGRQRHARFQDVGWAGLKKNKEEARGKTFEYEGPMINHINRSIETTHRLTGMPRAEIVRRGLIRKEIPMYGLGGLSAMGGLAAQDEYR